MQILALFGGLVTLVAHLPLARGVITNKIRLNLATWLLWAIIDGISLLASIAVGAPAPFMIVAFVIADCVITFLLLAKGTWRWGTLETFCAIVALVCLGIWYIAGPLIALIALVTGKYSAGLPSLLQAYRSPERSQSLAWLLFAFGAATNILAAGSFTIAQSLYPSVGLVFNGLMGLFHLRKSR